MGNNSSLYTQTDKLKKAIQWISETTIAKPDIVRSKLIQEAELRFDLSPSDCHFLDTHFSTEPFKNS